MSSSSSNVALTSTSRRFSYPTRPALLTLLALFGILTCCTLYGRWSFYRDPGSIFFDESRAFVRWYSAYRQRQAEEFIDRVASLEQIGQAPGAQYAIKAGPSPTVCATFLTVAREGLEEQYLEASIGSALDRLTVEERKDIILKVFFANTKPSKHPTWRRPWLRDLVDQAYTYSDVSKDVLAKAKKLESAHNPFAKSPYDYTIPLQHCYNNSASPYIAVFEDDIIIAEGWLSRALLALHELETKMTKQKRSGKWLYARLFNQERSTGWGSQKIGGNNEIPISVAIGLVIWACFRLLRKRSRMIQHHLDGWTTAVICCIGVPAFVVLFFRSGKASLLPPSPGVKEEFFGCCAQGIIFNREHVPGLVNYMRQPRSEGQDMTTRDYAWEQGLARWSIYPMSIQHVGGHSTIQSIDSESRAVWSMAFETLDPDRLHREHEEMVKQLYGAASEHI